MIVRMWHGVTPKLKADEYLAFLKRTAIPDYRSVKGNKGVLLLRRIAADQAHLHTFTVWESLEAVKRFAGEDVSRAKYYPEDADFLLEFEPVVEHFEAHGFLNEWTSDDL